jgi:hypothetical protein
MFSMFQDRYKTGPLFTRLVSFTTSNCYPEEKAAEILDFFSKNFNPGERTIKQNIENIRLNAAWLQRDEQSLTKYFTQQK